MARPDTIFQGDDDSMVDRLIEACQSAKSASPTRPELIGRELVVVDCAWLDVPLPAHVAAQYERPSSCGNSSHGTTGQRKTSNSAPGSPGRGSKACSLKASSVPSPASSTASGHSTKKSAGRANSAKLASATPGKAGSPVRSASARVAVAAAAVSNGPAAQAKRQPQALRGHAAARNNSMPLVKANGVGANTAPSSPRNTSPACPGHFRSPQPHLLPVPTSSLLLKAATSSATQLLLAEVKLPRFATHDGELSQFLASQTVPPAAA